MRARARAVLVVVLCGAALAAGACQQENQSAGGSEPETTVRGDAPISTRGAAASDPPESSTPWSATSTGRTTTTVRTVFDHRQMQTAVWRMLADHYDIDNVQAVSCPSGQEVVDGNTFYCTATIAGQQVDVLITVKGDDGKYVVSRPDLDQRSAG